MVLKPTQLFQDLPNTSNIIGEQQFSNKVTTQNDVVDVENGSLSNTDLKMTDILELEILQKCIYVYAFDL